ncbi:MAG: hydrogenase maturation nickel metallochaperone HypA [Spirochaetaceae bacterium]|nr:MAG: hydrogenase maturation nickel metallochaperone HypA [Spirochaetaceae bacterium]
MHEFSIAESIMKFLQEEIGKMDPRPAKVLTVKVIIGDMHQIVLESLQMAWEALCIDTHVFYKSSLIVKTEPIILKCNKCCTEDVKNGYLFICNKCGSRDVEITGGREFYIEDIRVESDG